MTDEKSNPRRALVSEGILVAISSGAAYVAGFAFWFNYCVRFGIPVNWIALTPGDFVPLSFLLFSGCQGAIFAAWTPPFLLPERAKAGRGRSLTGVRMFLLLFVYVSISLAFASLWIVAIPTMVMLFILSACVVGRLPLFFRNRAAWREWDEASGRVPDPVRLGIQKLGRGWFLVSLIVLVLIGGSGTLGFVYALIKSDYLTVGQSIVLARFGDDFVLAKFDEANHEVCPGLRIIRIEGTSTPEMDLKRVGRLKPTYWPPFDTPVYPKPCQ